MEKDVILAKKVLTRLNLEQNIIINKNRVLKKMLSDSKTDHEQSYISGQMKSNEYALKALKDTINVVLWNVDLEKLEQCEIF